MSTFSLPHLLCYIVMDRFIYKDNTSSSIPSIISSISSINFYFDECVVPQRNKCGESSRNGQLTKSRGPRRHRQTISSTQLPEDKMANNLIDWKYNKHEL